MDKREEKVRLKKKQEAFMQSLLNDYAETFKTPHGMRVLNDILKRGNFFNTSFTGNSETFKKEGMRELALYIMSAIMQTEPNIVSQAITVNDQLKAAWNKY